MMSDEELKAIDDWRFTNRIATRSEAIRRLAASGLKFHEGAPLFIERGKFLVEEIAALENDLLSAVQRLAPPDQDATPKIGDIDANEALALAALCVEISEKLIDEVFSNDEKNFEWVRSSLLQTYGPEFDEFTRFPRVNEWLRAFVRKAKERR